MLIRITLSDKTKVFINENHKGIELVDNIQKAFNYQSTLEFKVTWKLLNVLKDWYDVNYHFNKEDIMKFESIDSYSLESKEFDIRENEIKIGKELHIDPITFRKLMRCGITSSHWLYDNQDNWIAFPEGEDYNKITKIRYYKRGLTHTITSHSNWNRRYDKHSWHSVYELHHTCMMNPIIQQICLLNLDCCHEFTIYEKNLN